MGTRTYLDYNVGFERDDKGDLIRDNDGNPIKQKPIQRTMENDIVGFELNPIELSLTYTVQSSKEGMLVELTFQD